MPSYTTRIAGVLAALGALAAPGAASATTCTYDPVTDRVELALTAPAPNGVTTLSRVGNSIIWRDGPPGSGVRNCGGASVNTTDSIVVIGTAKADHLIIDQSTGDFAPGIAAEPGGLPEVEITVDLIGPVKKDTVEVHGAGTSDLIAAGVAAGGAALVAVNSDGDADVTIARVPKLLTLLGQDGLDVLTGQGGAGIGGAYTGSLSLDGGNSADSLSGGSGRDTITGGPGTDQMFGFGDVDTFFAADGIAETIVTGGGADVVDADVVDTVI
jgi:hypothetical protein